MAINSLAITVVNWPSLTPSLNITKACGFLLVILTFCDLLQEKLDYILHVLDDLLILATVQHPDLHFILGGLGIH